MGEDRAVTAAELFHEIGAGYEAAFGRPPVVDAAVRELLAVLPEHARVPVDFLGHPVRLTDFAADDLVARVRAAGLEVVGTRSELFAPDKAGAEPEEHLLITARKA
ncbi:MAG TPA: hypothetical protein VGH57_29280 [Amycolatopsis sp.]